MYGLCCMVYFYCSFVLLFEFLDMESFFFFFGEFDSFFVVVIVIRVVFVVSMFFYFKGIGNFGFVYEMMMFGSVSIVYVVIVRNFCFVMLGGFMVFFLMREFVG